MTLGIVILALVTLQRIGELWLSSRNTKALLAQGAREHAPGHYPLIVAVHVLWLAALWWLAPRRPVDAFWLAMFVIIEIGRIWVLAILGPRWTTRKSSCPTPPSSAADPTAWSTIPITWSSSPRSPSCR